MAEGGGEKAGRKRGSDLLSHALEEVAERAKADAGLWEMCSRRFAWIWYNTG